MKTSPITQRVKKSTFKQTLSEKEGKLGYETKDENVVENVVDKINASTGVVTGQMPGAKMSDEDWTKYLAQESDERRAERHQVEQKAGVREGVITQDEADAQNLANEKKKVDEVKPKFKEITTPETSKDVLSRWQAGNQVRRENMLDRKDHTNVNKNYRGLKKQSLANWRAAGRPGTRKDAKKGFGLNEEQQTAYDYATANRKNRGGGIGDFNTATDSSGKLVITGSKNDAFRNTSGRAKGTNVVTGGGSNSGLENLYAAQEQGHKLNAEQLARIDADLARKGISNPKTNSVQTGTSTFKNLNPTSSNKQTSGGGIIISQGDKFVQNIGGKVSAGTKLPAASVNNLPVKSNTMTKLNKAANTMKDTKTKGKYGTALKIIGGIGALATSFWAGSKFSSSDGDDEKDPTPVPKTTKSWDQAYKDRDKKVYGGEYYDKEGTGKSNYIKEAKRQKGIHATTGKWDWKNAPNRADVKKPVVKPSVKPEGGITPNNVASVSTNVSDDFKKNTDTLLDNVNVPTSFDGPKDTKKQTKAKNKISRLEGRKSTPKRDIRIAKQKDKAAGMSRGDVSARKQQRKFFTKNKGAIDQAITSISGVQSNINPINLTKSSTTPPSLTSTGSLGNPNIDGINSTTQALNSLKAREADLQNAINKKNTSFKQKGWKGYQKK